MAEHNKKGVEGEQIAQKYLSNLDYKILETNWRFQKAEVDIIAKNNDFLVFVEVKTRANNLFGEPQTFVTEKKQALFKSAAEGYLEQKDLDYEIRFDVISVILGTQKAKIEHFKDVF
ncbi:MAG TPA: YraN family protein [Flavobacteriales bacterium]|nr:YraN family protein [Flavobacteriales bacterium]